MTKVLIFGVTGQDGAFLAKNLVKKGKQVHGTTRNIQNVKNLSILNIVEHISLYQCNIADDESIKSIVTQVCPDEIYFLSGQTSVGESFSTPVFTIQANTLAVLSILETIKNLKLKCKFYNAGSSEIFGNTSSGGASETTKYNPLSPYAISKIFAMNTVKYYRENYGIYAVNGILFNHESFLRSDKFVTQKIIAGAAAIKFGKTNHLKLGNLNISRDWGWAPEFVDVMQLMLRLTDPEDFVIGTGVATSLEKFVKKVFDYFSLDYKQYVSSDPSFIRPQDITFSKSDPSKAQRILNWTADVTLDQSIEMMCDYQMKKFSK
ncbi:hypothetical protein UF64_00295 [Thalassospira sp. HJ]|uniref:GDP-mannose 4,6-dehydratase n=1 Tax=Thalassospira sp. HJ TaxID=1616823 RepID=UPI0005CF09BF|nr:GDP-mannose 4,6-dehydratase [Thalassospira sp. HJ]KJE37161.1 hypothetical protein UF64_00295 [Thalassospira sp. HJ]